jgi:hypothetical protein
MSSRERWIIYPLLFLTLGITMRQATYDKWIPSTRIQAEEIVAGQIRCNLLQVDQELGAKRIRCDGLQSAGVIGAPGVAAGLVHADAVQILGPNRRPTVIIATDRNTKGGCLTTLSAEGTLGVLLQSTDSGGVVIASDIRKVRSVPAEQPKTPPTPSPENTPKEPGKATPDSR